MALVLASGGGTPSAACTVIQNRRFFATPIWEEGDKPVRILPRSDPAAQLFDRFLRHMNFWKWADRSVATRLPNGSGRPSPSPCTEQRVEVAFGEQRHAARLSLRQLGHSGLLADDEAGRLLRHRVRDLGAERLQRSPRLLA